MSHFFSRVLIIPTMASFLLLPYRSSAQLGNRNLPQREATIETSSEQDVEDQFSYKKSSLEISFEKAESQIIDKIKEICEDSSYISLTNLEKIVSQAYEKYILLTEDLRNELESAFMEQLYSNKKIEKSQEFKNSFQEIIPYIASGAVTMTLAHPTFSASIPTVLNKILKKPIILFSSAFLSSIVIINIILQESHKDWKKILDEKQSQKLDPKRKYIPILCSDLKKELGIKETLGHHEK